MQTGRVSSGILAAILVALCIGSLVFEFARRHALYWYDVDRDYEYGLTDKPAGDVWIDGHGFWIPSDSRTWQSGVIAIEVLAAPSGYWFEPCIEIGPDAKAQCFERGAAGQRYLVLDPSLADRNGFVALHGRHLRWHAASMPLWLFENASPAHGPVLVLAPHPDDAEIAAFGLYSGTSSYVVTMTPGNYVDGLYAGLASSHEEQDRLRGDVRTWDSLSVPLWGGATADRTVNLGYPTLSLAHYHARAQDGEPATASSESIGRYRQGAVAQLLRSRLASPDWQSVVEDLATVIATIQPSMIASPHPMLDAHTDHQYTTIALLEALARIEDRQATLLLYTNHHPRSESYPYGSSEAMVALPPVFDSTLPVPGVLSVPLSADVQLKKLFALEAMHDLRAPPLRLSGGPALVLGDRFRQAWELILRDPFGDYSYYRRAVRPNEVFLTYAPEDRRELRRYLEETLYSND